MSRDVKKISSTVNIVDLINKYVTLKKRGNKLMGVCPFHNDHKSSLMVSNSKQIFKCFACGAGGDMVDFIMRMFNCTFHEAVDKLENKVELELEPVQMKLIKSEPKWTQVTHPKYFPRKIRHYEYGKPSQVWGYHNADGYPMGYVCRFNIGDDKEIIPYVFATNGKRSEWRWMGFDKPRPLYNLHQLVIEKDKPVLVVEGEKAADATKKLAQKHVVVSWQGGAEAIHNSDFTPLNGRKVLFIPDNDEPGFKAMRSISQMIEPEIHAFVDTSKMPKHWDIADEPEWDSKDLLRFMYHNTVDNLDFKEAA